MRPITSRDFQRAAAQRLTAAEVLLRARLTLDAQYLAGYTVECSLKALLIRLTSREDRPRLLAKITAGARWHLPDELRGELKTLGVVLPLELAKRMRKFRWNTSLRYESGRGDTGETTAVLKTARAIYEWVEGQLP
jgi:HEPN domain-containing protein